MLTKQAYVELYCKEAGLTQEVYKQAKSGRNSHFESAFVGALDEYIDVCLRVANRLEASAKDQKSVIKIVEDWLMSTEEYEKKLNESVANFDTPLGKKMVTAAFKVAGALFAGVCAVLGALIGLPVGVVLGVLCAIPVAKLARNRDKTSSFAPWLVGLRLFFGGGLIVAGLVSEKGMKYGYKFIMRRAAIALDGDWEKFKNRERNEKTISQHKRAAITLFDRVRRDNIDAFKSANAEKVAKAGVVAHALKKSGLVA